MGRNTVTATHADKPADKSFSRVLRLVALILAAVVLTVVLGVVVLAPVITCANAQIVPDSAMPDEYMENWMKYISDDALITDIAIPGSHDSGCIDMNYLAQTQDLTFAEQLKRGVRYFDIRVNKTADGLRIYHGPVNGVSYLSVLEDIADFVKTHPDEFLILDMSHFKNGSEPEVFALLEEYVGTEHFLINDYENPRQAVDTMTLGEVRGKCLILIDRDETNFAGKNYLFERTNDPEKYKNAVLTSLYEKKYNRRTASYFVENVIPFYIESFKSTEEGLFVLQAQLTDAALVFGPRYSESRLVDKMNAFVYGLYASENVGNVNIIMRDFVDCEKSALTLRLNLAKGTVKPEFTEEFQAMVGKYIHAEAYTA